MRTSLVSLALVLMSSVACSKREPPKPRTEPWENPAYRASASASPEPSGVRQKGAKEEKFVLDAAASRVAFSLPAKEATPRGTLSASGELTYFASDPARSRARLSFDLTSVVMEGGADEGGTFTARALEWLELGSGVAATVRERHRFAVFELASLSGIEPGSRSSGSARGQLALHGFRVPVELPIEIERREDGGLEVRSRRPLSVRLSEHDIVPRNAAGELRSVDLPLLGSRVGKEVRVEPVLVFRPTGAH